MTNTTSSPRVNHVPRGFSLAGVHCGIKKNPAKEDLSLVLIDRPATAAGVYTQNKFPAAPVQLDRDRTPSAAIRAVVINSGNANACTGQRGMEDAVTMCRNVASSCDVEPESVLVMSTGVIGNFLPMGSIQSGIKAVTDSLGNDDAAIRSAARGILTSSHTSCPDSFSS